MVTISPFDALIIESPFEYDDIYIDTDIWGIKGESLKNLGDLCRENDIPVFLSNSGKNDDSYFREFFEDCDYRPNLELNQLEEYVTDGNIKIMITGGYLSFIDSDDLIKIAKTNPEIIQNVNLNLTDVSKEIVLMDGCVPARAAEILTHFSNNQNIEPTIYLDGESSVDIENKVDSRFVYRVNGVGYFDPNIQAFDENIAYVITKKILREEIIPP